MESKIKEAIKKEFNASVLSISKMSGGYSHFMFDVKIDKTPFEVVIRFSNNTNPEYNLDKEKYVMNLLAKKGLPMPKIYASSKEYLIIEKINAPTIENIWDSLGENEKINLSREIGKLLKKIHRITFDDFGYVLADGSIKGQKEGYKFKSSGEKKQHSKFLRVFFNDFSAELHKFMSYPDIDRDFLINFLTYVIKNSSKLDYNSKPVLTHGDFQPSHIFVKKINEDYKIIGLIDIEHAKAFSPEYDFIKLHRKGFFDDPALKKALLAGYGQINTCAVEIHRVIRDFQFAVVLMESGDLKKAKEVISGIKKRIKS